MRVRLRNPDREVQVVGGRPVSRVLDELADEVLPREIYERAGR